MSYLQELDGEPVTSLKITLLQPAYREISLTLLADVLRIQYKFPNVALCIFHRQPIRQQDSRKGAGNKRMIDRSVR